MVKEAYDKVPLLLSDGTEVTLKPLVISRLKRFMIAFGEMKSLDKEDETGSFDIFTSCAGIALEGELSSNFETTKADSKKKDENHISTEYREYLEETLDMETIYKVLEVCAGIKLNDPNLLRAALEQMEDGKN